MKLKLYLQSRNASELARNIGVSPVLVSQWSNEARRVPAERCIEIEKATCGAVPCEDLRPDIDWSYIRGTALASETQAA